MPLSCRNCPEKALVVALSFASKKNKKQPVEA